MAARARRVAAGRALGLFAVLLCAVLATACVRDSGGKDRFDPVKKMAGLDDDEERELGYQVDREIEKQVGFVEDPLVVGFLNDLGQTIVARTEPQPFIYRFRVIENPELNAFAVPGGYVYFHSGTLLGAGSVDELAGVMAHEIGHVKGHHVARMREKAAIPSLLATLAGLGATVASGEAAPLLIAQGVNQALQLKFSREFEAEADQVGMVFMSRAGFDPRGMARFFERIVQAQDRGGIEIPPYLYSHPDVKDRIAVVDQTAATLRVTGERPPGLERELVAAQTRLALLVKSRRPTLPSAARPADLATTDPLLAEAERLAAAGDREAALVVLSRAEDAEPNDPRVSFRRGELLEEAGRRDQAIAAWRRTLALDPTRAQVLYRMGLACKARGDRHRAVFYLEQAARRFGAGSEMQKKAEREVEKLTFRVLESAGLADGADSRGADTVAGFSREEFTLADGRALWWGTVHPRYQDKRQLEKLRVRWIAPGGDVALDQAARRTDRSHVTAELGFADVKAAPGGWRVEAVFEGDVVDAREFRISSEGGKPD
jgi:predicted Zn-dependent protease